MSVSVFDGLGFRRFTSEPGENCASVDEDFTKYNCFSAKSIDIWIYSDLILRYQLEQKAGTHTREKLIELFKIIMYLTPIVQ